MWHFLIQIHGEEHLPAENVQFDIPYLSSRFVTPAVSLYSIDLLWASLFCAASALRNEL